MCRTGSLSSKNQPKGVPHFATVDDQIFYISTEIVNVLDQEMPGDNEAWDNLQVIFEGLSYASMGDATRNLAGLYFVLRNSFYVVHDVQFKQMTAIAPTSIKAFARPHLPEALQTELSKKTNKPIKCKMTKKLMVQAAEARVGKEFFEGLNMSTGKDDLADAYWLGALTLSKA